MQNNNVLKVITLREAWTVYKIIQHAMSPDDPTDLEYIMYHAEPGTMQKVVDIIFEEHGETNPLETALLFISGMQTSGFNEFVKFIRSITNGNSRK